MSLGTGKFVYSFACLYLLILITVCMGFSGGVVSTPSTDPISNLDSDTRVVAHPDVRPPD